MNETEAYELERAFNAARVGKGLPPVAEHGRFCKAPFPSARICRSMEQAMFTLFLIQWNVDHE